MTLHTPTSAPSDSKTSSPASGRYSARPAWVDGVLKLLLWGIGLAAAGFLGLLMVIAVALAVAYPNLPYISDLSDYPPKLPMRVYS